MISIGALGATLSANLLVGRSNLLEVTCLSQGQTHYCLAGPAHC